MKSRDRPNSGDADLFALFLLFARFLNDRIALRGLRAEAFGASRRFSSWLARTGRCAKLHQKGVHDPTNLPGSDRTAFGLPRQERLQTKFARQIQLEEHQGHNPTPTHKLLRSAHMRLKPEQILFEKPEEMFFRETQAVARWHLLQGHHVIQGEKPTHARITLGVACRGSFDAHHRERQVAILLKMNLLEATHPCHSALLIGGLPGRRRTKLRFWARPLQQRPILRWTTKFEATHRLAIELAI